VRYYATASGPRVREAMRAGLLGQIATPGSGHRVLPGVDWCADNAAFPGEDTYLAWLSARAAHAGRCAFSTAPDVPFDAAATLARSLPMLDRIRAAGFPVAVVAQDGLEDLAVPWDDIDALFIGPRPGSSGRRPPTLPGRLAPVACGCTSGQQPHPPALRPGDRLPLGGLNRPAPSLRSYGPDRNLPVLLRWLSAIHIPPPARPHASPPAQPPSSRRPAPRLPCAAPPPLPLSGMPAPTVATTHPADPSRLPRL